MVDLSIVMLNYQRVMLPMGQHNFFYDPSERAPSAWDFCSEIPGTLSNSKRQRVQREAACSCLGAPEILEDLREI
jgi:hypothetical protein